MKDFGNNYTTQHPTVRKKLNQLYSKNRFPSRSELQAISTEFDIKFNKLQRWFQNKRCSEARAKRKSSSTPQMDLCRQGENSITPNTEISLPISRESTVELNSHEEQEFQNRNIDIIKELEYIIQLSRQDTLNETQTEFE